MLTKKRYSPKEMISWTRWEIIAFFLFSLFLTYLYRGLGFTFVRLPWAPVAVVGTAVAFIVGFQNNAAYDRIWEARKIWGGIVNVSRTFGVKVRDMINNDHASSPMSEEKLKEVVKVIVYRHYAWLTALRHGMRQNRKWEVFDEHSTNKEWSDIVHIPEKVTSVEDDLLEYLGEDDRARVLKKSNHATAILYLQSEHLRKLQKEGYLWEFSFLELENLIQELFSLQGKSERIKNFPYPRQYATLSYYFVWLFCALLPFATIPEFAKLGTFLAPSFPILSGFIIWGAVPFCVLVSWIFYTMERIGRVGENPFEGSANDVPISTIARGIEIDMRQQFDEDSDSIPSQFPEKFHVQM